MEEPEQAPPLGVKPRWLHEEQRLKDLGETIVRWVQIRNDIRLPIPLSWVEEYNTLAENAGKRVGF